MNAFLGPAIGGGIAVFGVLGLLFGGLATAVTPLDSGLPATPKLPHAPPTVHGQPTSNTTAVDVDRAHPDHDRCHHEHEHEHEHEREQDGR